MTSPIGTSPSDGNNPLSAHRRAVTRFQTAAAHGHHTASPTQRFCCSTGYSGAMWRPQPGTILHFRLMLPPKSNGLNYPLVNVHITNWKDPPCFMDKSTISMDIFNSKLLVITRGYHVPNQQKDGASPILRPIRSPCLSTLPSVVTHGNQHREKQLKACYQWIHSVCENYNMSFMCWCISCHVD